MKDIATAGCIRDDGPDLFLSHLFEEVLQHRWLREPIGMTQLDMQGIRVVPQIEKIYEIVVALRGEHRMQLQEYHTEMIAERRHCNQELLQRFRVLAERLHLTDRLRHLRTKLESFRHEARPAFDLLHRWDTITGRIQLDDG